MNINPNAEKVIREQFQEVENKDIQLVEYVKIEAENDPNFFRWLFNEDFDNDFDRDLTPEHREIYEDFLKSLIDCDRQKLREYVGTQLRKFRESEGLTAYAVAKKGGLQHIQISRIEKGENYTIDLLFAYMEGCGCDVMKIIKKIQLY